MKKRLKEVALKDIAFVGNVRSEMGNLESLAASFQDGQPYDPPTVAEKSDDGLHPVITGHRRIAAARLAGAETITVYVEPSVPPHTRVLRQLVENIQRENLNPIDEANAIKALAEMYSQKEIASYLGKSEPWVSQRLGLLKLAKSVKRATAKGEIGVSVAEALTRLPRKQQPRALKLVRKKTLQQASALVAQALVENGIKTSCPPKAKNQKDLYSHLVEQGENPLMVQCLSELHEALRILERVYADYPLRNGDGEVRRLLYDAASRLELTAHSVAHCMSNEKEYSNAQKSK